MKALTIKQPWATLIQKGYKKYEFRTWKTNYRGDVLIHAGKGVDKCALEKLKDLNLEYPIGVVLCKATITDCIELNPQVNNKINESNPLIYGEKNRVGYAWKLENIRVINSDKEVKGKLSFWEIDEKIFENNYVK